VAVEVMNSIPIDIAVLGNHEFDFGDEVLMERIRESDCKWLGSNVYYPSDDTQSSPSALEGYFPGIEGNGVIYTLLDNLKLGVFGLCTKQTPKISYPSPRVKFDEDVIAVARRTCQHLRVHGAQVIVAITHMSEAEDLLLAKDKEAGVDLIVGGHEHEPLSSLVHRGEDSDHQNDNNAASICQKLNQGGVLVFKCGMNAYWVGTVDLDIEYESSAIDTSMIGQQQQPRVTSISTSWAMHSVSSQIPEDPQVTQIVQQHRKKTEKRMLVASFGEDMASQLNIDDVIASIENPHDNPAALPLDTRMSSVRRREATGSNLVADAMHWMLVTNIKSAAEGITQLPMLAMINGGFIRADRMYQPGSNFTVRHLLKELPFPRGMVVLKLLGKHLKDALAQQLKGSSRGPTGQSHVLHCVRFLFDITHPSFLLGSFPHLSHNARMIYDISFSESGDEVITILSLTVDGADVSDEQEYLIAVTGFVADGSENCTSWLQSCRVDNDAWKNKMISGIVLEHLQQHPVIRPRLENRVVNQVN
jgi:5'-nucleotidase